MVVVFAAHRRHEQVCASGGFINRVAINRFERQLHVVGAAGNCVRRGADMHLVVLANPEWPHAAAQRRHAVHDLYRPFHVEARTAVEVVFSPGRLVDRIVLQDKLHVVAGDVVRSYQVEFGVAIQIGNRHVHGPVAGREGLSRHKDARIARVLKQDCDGIVSHVADCQIRVSITVKIPNGQAMGLRTGGTVVHSRQKRTWVA